MMPFHVTVIKPFKRRLYFFSNPCFAESLNALCIVYLYSGSLSASCWKLLLKHFLCTISEKFVCEMMSLFVIFFICLNILVIWGVSGYSKWRLVTNSRCGHWHVIQLNISAITAIEIVSSYACSRHTTSSTLTNFRYIMILKCHEMTATISLKWCTFTKY